MYGYNRLEERWENKDAVIGNLKNMLEYNERKWKDGTAMSCKDESTNEERTEAEDSKCIPSTRMIGAKNAKETKRKRRAGEWTAL